MTQLTSEQAIAFFDANAYEPMTARQRSEFQLWQDCLCMPFDVFHESLEATLGRPVWTHELAFNRDGLKAELLGNRRAPTFKEIVELIPEEKRVVIVAKGGAR